MESISGWLQEHNLGQYEQLFVDNDVDMVTLRLLSDADLQELGLPFGPRKRLLHGLAADAQPDNTTATATDNAAAASRTTHELGERRQLTVLFCDMVGYTPMAVRLDPEVLQSIVRLYETTCAACINRYEGYVFQRLGDGIVAFFGYPLAHEGEAERAIRAALAIVHQLESLEVPAVGRLEARIGIATGEVVVAPGAGGAVGETMNLAARLQDRSEPGRIVVSERVHRVAGGTFDYDDLGAMALKGIARPTRAYRVRGVSSAATRFDAATEGGLTPLVGRELEVGLLMERWQSAQDGEGQVVLLSGEPGIGKSRILDALRERLEGRGVEALRFQCSPYHLHSPFYPIVDHLERAIGIDRNAAASANLDRLEAFMATRNQRSRDDLKLIAHLLSVPFEDRYGTIARTPQRLKDETLRALEDLPAATALAGPSVMLFEDLHWADPTTVEVLDRLVDRISNVPLLIVLSHRPEFQPRWLGHGHVTTLNLAKFTRPQSHRLITRLTHGKALPEGLIDQIVERTDGVPLFIEELTKSIIESGDLVDAGDRYVMAHTNSRVTIPSTLRDLLMARLDQEASVKEVAQIGAAIGRSFSYELISAIAPATATALVEQLDRLQASGLAFRHGAIPNARFTFKHALVQDAAYESMLKSRRQVLHGKIARVLEELFPATAETEPELLAQHYAAAGEDTPAIHYLRKAGELAMRRFAMAEAAVHLRRGLELRSTLPTTRERDVVELEIRRLLGPTVVALKGWADTGVVEILEPAWHLARRLDHRESFIPVLHGLWVHSLTQGRLGQSKRWADQMLEVAQAHDDEDLKLCGHRAAMTSHFWLGELVQARAHGDTLRDMYDFDRHWHIATLTNSDPLSGDGTYRGQYIWMLGYPDQAHQVTLDNHAHARRRAHPFDEGFALTLGSEVFDFCVEPDKLLLYSKEADEVGREHRIPVMYDVMAVITQGIATLRHGDVEASVPQLREGIRRLNDTGQRIWGPYLRAVLADALVQTGDAATAMTLIDEALNEVETRNERPHHPEILRIKGVVLAALGHKQDSERLLREAIALAQGQQARSWELRAATTLAGMLAERGEGGEARDVLAPIYNWFTEGLDTHDLLTARLLLKKLGN